LTFKCLLKHTFVLKEDSLATPPTVISFTKFDARGCFDIVFNNLDPKLACYLMVPCYKYTTIVYKKKFITLNQGLEKFFFPWFNMKFLSYVKYYFELLKTSQWSIFLKHLLIQMHLNTLKNFNVCVNKNIHWLSTVQNIEEIHHFYNFKQVKN